MTDTLIFFYSFNSNYNRHEKVIVGCSCIHQSTQVSGFDKQLLNSLYDDAIQRRLQAAAAQRGGSPMPSGVINPFEDIFAASNNYAPPSPVSMAMMQEQAFLMQTQQRLARMPGSNPFGDFGSSNPFDISPGSPQSSTSPPPQLALPPQLTQQQQQQQQDYHLSNPFGNPNLLWNCLELIDSVWNKVTYSIFCNHGKCWIGSKWSDHDPERRDQDGTLPCQAASGDED